jgi:hypothetical protein
MEFTLIIPKRHRTFARCLTELLRRPEHKAFQSELKRIVFTKSWRQVVKREFALWNRLIVEEFPGHCLVVATPTKNPSTGKTNEVLYQVDPKIEVHDRPTHFFIKIKRGDAG